MLKKRRNKNGDMVYIKSTYIEFVSLSDYNKLKHYCAKKGIFIKDFVKNSVVRDMVRLNIIGR